MFCRYCGKSIPDDSEFCTYCGKSLLSEKQQTENKERKEEIAPCSKSKISFLQNNKKLLAIIVSCVFFASSVVGLFWYSKYAKRESVLPIHSLILIVGQSYTFPVKCNLQSSDSNIVEVVGTEITAKSPGTIKINSNLFVFNDSCAVKVIEESISFYDGPGKTFDIGENFTFKMDICCASDNPNTQWKSSNPSVATVDQNGTIKGISEGETTITATLQNGLSASYLLTINPPIVFQENGLVKNPSGYREAPVTIHAPSDNSCYVYFKSLNNIKNDFSVFVNNGTIAEVLAPIGSYEVFYASGTKWYGTKFKFGRSTRYFRAEDQFSFYYSGDYVYGTELTLYNVLNGNLETEAIDESQFPE